MKPTILGNVTRVCKWGVQSLAARQFGDIANGMVTTG